LKKRLTSRVESLEKFQGADGDIVNSAYQPEIDDFEKRSCKPMGIVYPNNPEQLNDPEFSPLDYSLPRDMVVNMDLLVEKRLDIQEALSALKPREAEILRMHFGFYGRERTLEEIGKHFNITRQRVRQIKETALRRLNYPEIRGNLEQYL